MAAGIFENQDVPASGGGVSPQQAVAPVNNSQVIASAAQGLGGLFSGIAQGYAANEAKAKQGVADNVMSSYARKVTGLNAAVEQGTKTQAVAQREQRAMYNQLVANFPSLTEKLTTFNSSLAGSDGLGNVLAKGTAVDQQIQTDTKSATAAGFVQPGMTPSQQQAGLDAYRDQQHQINSMDFYSKKLGIQNQQLSLVEKQASIANQQTQRANAAMELSIKRNKQRLQTSLADVSSSYFTKTQGEIQAIQQSNMSPEEKLQRIDQIGANYNAITIQARGVAGSDYVDGLSKPIFDLIKTQKDYASGKITSDTMQNQMNALQLKAQLPIMSDPTAASLMAVSKLTGNTFDPVMISQFGSHMVSIVKNNMDMSNPPANPTPHDPDSKGQVKAYTGTIQEVTRNLANKDPSVSDPKGTMKELEAHVNQLVAGVNDFSSAQKNPQQLTNVVDYFASPEFLQYQKMGGNIDAANLEGAVNAVRINYGDKLIPAIQKEWENSKVVTQTSVAGLGSPISGGSDAGFDIAKSPDSVQYRWTGKSIVFKPAPGMERNTSAVAKSRELQQKLAPLINKSIMMRAHLDGSDNYTKYFQDSEQEMFGQKEETNGQ